MIGAFLLLLAVLIGLALNSDRPDKRRRRKNRR